MFKFLFKVEYYDSIDEVERKAFSIIRTTSFTEAVEKIERYFKKDLLSFTVTCLEDDLVQISEEAYNKMLKGEF
jgi:hypothetical protein